MKPSWNPEATWSLAHWAFVGRNHEVFCDLKLELSIPLWSMPSEAFPGIAPEDTAGLILQLNREVEGN